MEKIQQGPTHKIVNGKQVDLTDDEKKIINEDWESSIKDQEKKEAENFLCDSLKNSASLKLKSLGFSEEEIKLLVRM